MKIIARYLFTSILQKPFRLLLILMTLCLSGASILASVSLSDTMIKTTENTWRYEYGFSDIVITSDISSKSRYFNPYKADSLNNFFTYTVKKMSAGAKLGKERVTLHGYTLETLREMIYLPFVREQNVNPFEGNKIIISARFAEEKGVDVGDILTAEINRNRHSFVICAISSANGPFAYENGGFGAIIPFEKMQAALGQLGKADTLYIGLKDKGAKSRILLKLSTIYTGFKVSETYSMDHVRLQTNRSSVPFLFMSVLLCLLAVYVVYVIFQNIVLERMPQMGIYRAIGAGKGQTRAVVLLESVAYGTLGGGLSIGAGMSLLAVIARHLYRQEADGTVALSVSADNIALTLLATAGMSAGGALLSLMQYRGASISELIRKSPVVRKKAGSRGFILTGFLFSASLAVLFLWRSVDGLAVYMVLILIIMASGIIAAPHAQQRFCGLLKRVLKNKGGFIQMVSLTIQNQRGFLIASTILSVIVATTLIINTITFSNDEGARRYFQRFHYQLEFATGNLAPSRLNLISQLPGVLDLCPNYYSGSMEVKGQSLSIYRVHGVDTGAISDFMAFTFKSKHDDPISALDEGRNILLTGALGDIYNVEEGDSLILKFFDFNGTYKEVPYTIIGFFDDDYTKIGRYALISLTQFKEDFKAKQYSSVYIKSEDTQATVNALADAYRHVNYQMETVREAELMSREETRLILSSMKLISYLSVITGILGMFFIMMLSFKSRVKELSIYGAMGFSRYETGRMILLEMLLSGFLGLSGGILLGMVISFAALPRLIDSLQIAMALFFSPNILLRAALLGTGISVLSGIGGHALLRSTALLGGLRSE